jgi:hypothetical protein
MALARLIAEKSPIAVMSTKHLMNREFFFFQQSGIDDRCSRPYVRICRGGANGVVSKKAWNILPLGICRFISPLVLTELIIQVDVAVKSKSQGPL